MNRAAGFYANHHPNSCYFYNNTGYGNHPNFNMLGMSASGADTTVGVYRNNISFAGVLFSNRNGADEAFNSWTVSGVTVSDADFQGVSVTGMDAPRGADGSLPAVPNFHLAAGSDLIDKGTDVGLPFAGSAPDLGCFETGLAAAGGASGTGGTTGTGNGGGSNGGAAAGGAATTTGGSTSAGGAATVGGAVGAGGFTTGNGGTGTATGATGAAAAGGAGNVATGGQQSSNGVAGASPGGGASGAAASGAGASAADGTQSDTSGCSCSTVARASSNMGGMSALVAVGLAFGRLSRRRRRA
jgi:hypothetical protein